MANVGRLRLSSATSPEYLETPYDEADTREHFVQFALSVYKKHFLALEPAKEKQICKIIKWETW